MFVAFVRFFVILCTLTHFNPKAYSYVEKRELAQFPKDATFAELIKNESGNSPISKFEDYTVDQFPFREFFRSLKANFVTKVLNMNENNGYAVKEDSIVVVKPAYTEKVMKALTAHLE